MPQFDFLFQPMLIALAAGIGLVSARLWGGRGTALGAVAFFVVVRGFVSLMVHGVLGEALPHFPLYLVEALLVEATAAALLARRGPLVYGAVAGLLIGTVGIAAEWGWSHIWMPLPWPTALLPEVAVVSVLAGLAGGLVGAFIGSALLVRPQPFPRGARVVFPLAGLVVGGLVAFGLATSPQHGVSAQVQLLDVPGSGPREVTAVVRLDPPQAADNAKWLTTTAWQGGGLVVDRLTRVREGVYRTNEPIPVTATGRPSSASTAGARSSACRSTCRTTRRSRPRGCPRGRASRGRSSATSRSSSARRSRERAACRSSAMPSCSRSRSRSSP